MTVSEAQREMREVFRNGSVGQFVSGMLWLTSAAAATWGTQRTGILIIVGAHHLPFVTLYGLKLYAVLGTALIASGLCIALWESTSFTLGGWIGGGILLLFAVLFAASNTTSER
jgi:hypothetical protein